MSSPNTPRSVLAESDTREFVTLHVADQLCGVEVTAIHDVFAPQAITPVPLSPPEIAGVLNLRGRIVTAIDARARLGLPPRDDGRIGMAIGIEKGGESYGLIIDTVGEVLRVSDSSFETNPCNLDPRWQEVSKGVYRLEDRLLMVIDVDQMLDIEKKPVPA